MIGLPNDIRIIFFHTDRLYTQAICYSFSNFILVLKVWLNQHFFPQESNKLHSSESKKGDANEILLSMSVPDDAFSAVLFLHEDD